MVRILEKKRQFLIEQIVKEKIRLLRENQLMKEWGQYKYWNLHNYHIM